MENTLKAVEKWVKSHPYLKDIAALNTAFGKMLENFNVSADMPDIKHIKEQFIQGTPLLLTDLDLGIDNKAGAVFYEICKKGSESLIAELPEIMQNVLKDLSKLSEDNCIKIIKAVLEGNDTFLKEMAEKTGAAKEYLEYFAWVSIKKALSGVKAEIEEFISENGWQKGICPVCGNHASTAFFKHTKRGRQRFLHCDHCGTEWVYKRIGCPYCDNLDQKKMSIKDSEDEPDMRIDLCHNCNSYLKTYIGEDNNSAGKEGWASIHLDILMEDTGFTSKGSLVKP